MKVTAETTDIDSQPECDACGGRCCAAFYACPGGKTDEQVFKAIGQHSPQWVVGRKVWLGPRSGPRMAVFRCTCSWFIEGRCSQYADRPNACRRFPSPDAEAFGIRHYKCGLAKRLLRERADRDSGEASMSKTVSAIEEVAE